jgi:NACalpha-BTF3-like transcription factor
MKLIDILKELEKPSKIYDRDPNKEITIADLTPDEQEKLFQQGSIAIPIKDPSRPESSVSQVINLPKIDQVRKEVIRNKKEFDMFMYSNDEDIKNIAKQINKSHNELFKALTALDKMIALKKSGRI